MAHKIIMPKQGLQMTEGYMTQWLKKVGEHVALGEPLFEMETDKLTITIDSTAEGTLLQIVHPAGDTVPITEVIAYIGEPGEALPDAGALQTVADPVGQVVAEAEAADAKTNAPAAAVRAPGERVFVTPRARMRAEEKGYAVESIPGTGPDGLVIERDVLGFTPAAQPLASPLARREAGLSGVELADVKGSGAHGKIMADDVRTAATPAAPAPVAAERRETVVPMDGMRRGVATHMKGSLDSQAQANHRMLVDMTECVRLREQLKAAGVKVSYNDIVILCVSRALAEYPQINCVRDGNTIIQKHYVNVGMAVATDRGLLVPVITDADKRSLQSIAKASADLGARTKAGQLSPDELTGGTFTVTNLGMLGVDSFTAIINAPESGILAVGAMKKQPVVLPDDTIAARNMMWLSLTYDHCVIDGAPAARFLGRIKELLEKPALLL